MLSILKRLIKKPFTPLNLITISRGRLINNYQELTGINPEIKIAPVLKSNAYGHGIRLVGEILDMVDTPFLCVDSLYEAFQLKKAKARTPILIMGYIHPKSLSVKKLPFSFAVYDLEHAQVLNEYQKGSKVHIFVDTGMHREGVSMNELEDFLKAMKQLSNVTIEGIMSHLADPANPDSALTKMQLANFQKAKKLYQQFSLTTRSWKADIWFHLGGSYGLLNELTAECNLMRVGRAIYGIDWGRPVLKHTSTIVQIKKIKKGDKVGYNGSFVADKDMTVGVLPLGYNDGVDRRLSNRGVVTVSEVKCPIVGLVSMNITTIDLTNVKQPFIGQEVVIFSDNPKDPNSVVELSKKGKILPHEMLIHIAESTKRVVI
ncbi:alanine racemase [Candidatus Daviesbacteria bacterium]|nr:alanine racemase [Candidatus Daviesbacteria bacterium]